MVILTYCQVTFTYCIYYLSYCYAPTENEGGTLVWRALGLDANKKPQYRFNQRYRGVFVVALQGFEP